MKQVLTNRTLFFVAVAILISQYIIRLQSRHADSGLQSTSVNNLPYKQ